MNQTRKHYRPDELAQALDVSCETVRRWIRLGLIVHIHLRKGTRIPQEEYLRVCKEGVRHVAQSSTK